jgi:hypothetical protein
VPTLSLSEALAIPESDLVDESFRETMASYYRIVTFLAETYGPDVVARLLDNITRTDDLDEWLRLSTGTGLDDIQSAWEEWVLSTFRGL